MARNNDSLPGYDRWKLESPYDNDSDIIEWEDCDECGGTGWINTDDFREIKCPECYGCGKVEV